MYNFKEPKKRVFINGCCILTLLICLILGCAGGKTYFIDLKYLPDQSAHEKSQPVRPLTIGIKTFEDSRVEKEDLGKRIRAGGEVDIFKSYLVPVNQAVTQAIKDHLIAKGYQTVDILNWDLSPETLSDIPDRIHLVVGGKVEGLRSEVESFITRTNTVSKVKLVVHIGYVKEKKVIIKKVETAPEVTEILFKREKVEEGLNRAITEAIERIFNDLC